MVENASGGYQKSQAVLGMNLDSNDYSSQVIKTALPGFQAPSGMTQMPMMFSGSIPSLQYQESSTAIL